MGITKTRTTSYHPQCDGQTERPNRTIQAMLSAFASNRRDDWDLWLDSVTFAYNTSKHDALGISPYEVVFGHATQIASGIGIMYASRAIASGGVWGGGGAAPPQ